MAPTAHTVEPPDIPGLFIVEPFADQQNHPTLQLGIGRRASVLQVELMTKVSAFATAFDSRMFNAGKTAIETLSDDHRVP